VLLQRAIFEIMVVVEAVAVLGMKLAAKSLLARGQSFMLEF
jgi:hypothetical protein